MAITLPKWEGLKRPPFPFEESNVTHSVEEPDFQRCRMMNFFIAITPPTSTAQMKQVRVVKGKPIFYDPPAVKEARNALTAHLVLHKPDKPMSGGISLRVLWLFPRGKSHRNGEWRITKPDTDNLQKLLKDCMTRCGFWNDDAQVAREIIEKRWSDEPCGIYIELEELEVPQ